MTSSDEFQILNSNSLPDPPMHGLHRISSTSTLKSVYIETPSSSPYSSSCSKHPDLTLIKKAQLELLTSPLTLNILVLGDSNIGKTSFIRSLLIKYFNLINLKSKVHSKPTRSITSNKGTISSSDLELRVNLIDTPGFGFFSSKEKWFSYISEYIFAKSSEYKQLKKTVDKNQLEDKRVHLALYFIEGPRCKESDLSMMFLLQKVVSLIPVLAKADMFTQNEIVQVKGMILSQCIDAEINFFDIGAVSDAAKLLNSTRLGMIPPFAVVSAGKIVEIGKKLKFLREYPWGVLDVHCQESSDFKVLANLLFGSLVIPLIRHSKAFHRKNLKNLKIVALKVKKEEQVAERNWKVKWLSRVTSKLILNLL
jgi:septin 7